MKLPSAFASSVDRARQAHAQTALLYGAQGLGLVAIAEAIAPYHIRHIQPLASESAKTSEHTTISVTAIRDLYEQTRTSGQQQTVIIEQADRMTIAAQNALLKLLEEPTADTTFILTTHFVEKILPTVRSRTALFHIPQLTFQQSLDFLQAYPKLSSQEIQQLLFIAAGKPALLDELALNTNKRTAMFSVASAAKKFVYEREPYQQLLFIQPYTKSRTEARNFIETIILVLKHVHSRQPGIDHIMQLELCVDILHTLDTNSNVRLTLTNFVVQWNTQ